MIEGRSQFDENYNTFYPLCILVKKAKNLMYTTLASQNKMQLIDN